MSISDLLRLFAPLPPDSTRVNTGMMTSRCMAKEYEGCAGLDVPAFLKQKIRCEAGREQSLLSLGQLLEKTAVVELLENRVIDHHLRFHFCHEGI